MHFQREVYIGGLLEFIYLARNILAQKWRLGTDAFLPNSSFILMILRALVPLTGVPCSLNVKEGAKNTVTHHCKMYALNHAALCGVSYDETKYLGSHEVDVTRCADLRFVVNSISWLVDSGFNY